jgi:ribosomal protein L29
MKAKDIRAMSAEQRESLLKDTIKKLHQLRIQANMERLDSPSEVGKAKKLVARVKTIQLAEARKAALEEAIKQGKEVAQN